MPRKIHMQDQVGANKIEAIMSHYDRCSIDMWTMKFMVIGALLLLVVVS
jgi:predicted nucleic acid-binding Zn ribbon protein